MEISLILSVFAGVFLLVVHDASSCSCMPMRPEQSYCQADMVFRGDVKSVENVEVTPWHSMNLYAVDVVQVYKGHPRLSKGSSIVVQTAGSGAMCGLYMEPGNQYLIEAFSFDQNEDITTNACSNTVMWNELHPSRQEMYGKIDEKMCPSNPWGMKWE